MNKYLVLLLALVASEYFVCDVKGHACKVGQTCCPRSNGEYGCCPFENGVCCTDSEAHCCPLGYPICDTVHHKCSNHLQLSQELVVKSSTLNYKDASEFLFGLAAGLGIRVDEYVTCTDQLSITITLLLQASKYMQGSTNLDHLIVLQGLGEAMQHLSQASFSCLGALSTSVNFVTEFFAEVKDEKEAIWKMIGNFINYGNYIQREYVKIKDADWKGKGYHIGKLLTYLFRIN